MKVFQIRRTGRKLLNKIGIWLALDHRAKVVINYITIWDTKEECRVSGLVVAHIDFSTRLHQIESLLALAARHDTWNKNASHV